MSKPWSREKLLKTSAFLLGVVIFTGLLLWLSLLMEDFLEVSFPRLARYAYFLVFAVTLVSSAIVVLPAPVSLFALSFQLAVAAKGNPLWVVLAASSGSTLGEISSYFVGNWGRRAIVRNNSKIYQRSQRWMRRYGLIAIFFFAFFPSFFLFDLAGISAGVLRVPLWRFLLVVWAARLPRSALEIYTGGQVYQWLLSLFR